MSKQRHDPGYKKRHRNHTPKDIHLNTNDLAASLVERGLAPVLILGHQNQIRFTRHPRKETP